MDPPPPQPISLSILLTSASLIYLAPWIPAPAQASTFLCSPNKASLVLDNVTQRCPALNMQQLYRLCTTFYDDSERVEAPAAPTPQASLPVPADQEMRSGEVRGFLACT